MNLIKSLLIRVLRLLRVRRPVPDTYLIPAYAGLGNFIMATPMVLELKRRRPGARIFLLTWPSYGTDQVFDAPEVDVGCWMLDAGLENQQQLAESRHSSPGSHPAFKIQNSKSPSVSGIFLLDPGAPLWRKILFFLRLRAWRFRMGLILFDACPPFVWWGFALAGIGRLFGHSMEAMGIPDAWPQRVLDGIVPVSVGSHETAIHLDLLDRAVPPLDPHSPRDYATHMAAGGEEIVRAFGLNPGAYIVVQLSAANARFRTPKLWDRQRWAEVIRALEAKGETIVLPGDENEKPLVDEFVRCQGLSKAVNLAGRTSVREISTVIKYAKLLLVHDSGLMHIGNAHGTSLIALYGPTDWNFTMPKAATSRILRKNLECQPCMARMAKTEQEAMRDCKVDVQCMRDITVEDVLKAVGEGGGQREGGILDFEF